MIDYRVKLLLKNDTLLLAGETQAVNTSCLMKGKLKGSMSKFSMFLTTYENLPLSFESGGYRRVGVWVCGEGGFMEKWGLWRMW